MQCNNPLTKEPKLDAAVRIVKEWPDYDDEIKMIKSVWEQDNDDAAAAATAATAGSNGEFLPFYFFYTQTLRTPKVSTMFLFIQKPERPRAAVKVARSLTRNCEKNRLIAAAVAG